MRVNSWMPSPPTVTASDSGRSLAPLHSGPRPRPLALRARAQRHVLLDLLARPVRVGFAVAPLEVGDDALEGGHVRALAPVPAPVGDVDLLAVRPVEEAAPHLVVEVLPGG